MADYEDYYFLVFAPELIHQSLAELDLSHNLLVTFPVDLQYTTMLINLDLSNNFMDDSIPSYL